MVNSVQPTRILVIGGGPSGLVALRNLVERGDFERVELVERRNDIGGVWYVDSANVRTDVQKNGLIESGIRATGLDNRPRWPSPAYPGLVGNVLPEFLSFSGNPFPESSREHQPFPTLAETYEYLQNFAAPYICRSLVRLNTEVVAVEELPSGMGWRVCMRDWRQGQEGNAIEEIWDGVVVANGWYDNPIWPDTEGLDAIRELGLAKHAKTYTGPKEYEGNRCLVIGNANSSNDIAAQLRSIGKLPMFQSIRRPTFPGFLYVPDEQIIMVAPVARYEPKISPDGSKVDVHLTDGTTLTDIEAVLVGTGYKPYPSFVHVLSRVGDAGLHDTLVPMVSPTSPPHIPSLYKYILYAHNPSLAFIGAPMSYTPFTIADVSSTWLALVWSNKIPYPDTVAEMLLYEKKRMADIEMQRKLTKNPTAFLTYMVLATYEQEYAKSLREEAVKASPDLQNILPEWSSERTKLREAMWPVKLEALKYARKHGSYGNRN